MKEMCACCSRYVRVAGQLVGISSLHHVGPEKSNSSHHLGGKLLYSVSQVASPTFFSLPSFMDFDTVTEN